MYHYLTGAASWYLLTMITQVFGVRGSAGDLCVEPKLMAEQFDESGNAKLSLTFAGKRLHVTVRNPERKAYGSYRITRAILDETEILPAEGRRILIKKEMLDVHNESVHELVLTVE